MSSVSHAWERLERWLVENAPRTRASLLPPVPAAQVRDVVSRHGRRAPEALIALYGLAGGQHADAAEMRRGGAQGIFDGYWFMSMDGVDGLDQALEQLAPWDASSWFPFAKDFGGSYLCIDAAGRIVEIGDEGQRTVADDLASFLDETAARLENGDVVIDERLEERERHVVLFDACKPRNIGDAARHSVFDQLGITATIEDLEQLFGPFDKRPPEVHGLAARLVSTREIVVEEVALVDPNDRRLRALAGHQTGGGRPGFLVYTWDRRPLPSGARLRVTLASIRRT